MRRKPGQSVKIYIWNDVLDNVWWSTTWGLHPGLIEDDVIQATGTPWEEFEQAVIHV